MAKVTVIRPVSQNDSGEKIRVAAYCRVSSASERQQNSYQVQLEYYSHKFENSETEILVDVYADGGISGLSAENRDEFQRMMKDCRKGRIDRIYTKSISRFARNTRDCLMYVRELKSLGITVCFEKENLDTAKIADEMMLSVMAGLAQEESVSISKNQKWANRRRMQNGTYSISKVPYGFRKIDGKIEIFEDEARIVRKIFAWYLEGYGTKAIADMLNENSAFRKQKEWGYKSVSYIIRNERYIGDAVFQKNYTTDTLPFREKKNKGELPMYHVSGINDAIVSKEDFEKVQELYQRRTQDMKGDKFRNRYPLSQKITCACCGALYKHKWRKNDEVWVCMNHEMSAALCRNMPIQQEQIYQMFIALFNKLYCCQHEMISPLLNSMQELGIKKIGSNAQIIEIQKKSAELKEQIHVLTALRTKGFLSEDKYRQQTAELHQKISRMQKELYRLTASDNEAELTEKLEMLADFLSERNHLMTEFEEETFSFIVDSIVVRNQNELEFCILGGLHLTEHYPQNKR